MRIVVDVKNLALYYGGIAQFFAPLLGHWIKERPQDHFLLVGPDFDTSFLPPSGNWEHVRIPWPAIVPRPLRHPLYDNVLFPMALRRLRPEFVFSPYHDVRLPRGVRSVIMIHDTCLDELAHVYPRRVRWYYMSMLRRNLQHANHVLAVSESSRARIQGLYGLPEQSIHVVYNACHPEFLSAQENQTEVARLRDNLCAGAPLLFYPGGGEFRKNIGGLLAAFRILCENTAHPSPVLMVTGQINANWREHLDALSTEIVNRVKFLGYLDNDKLKQHYFAADAVVYPSLCEGFGRVCLESMVTGVPIACSDLPVMKEVGGNYPIYFDPYSPGDIAEKVRLAMATGRKQPVRDDRFTIEHVRQQFLSAIDSATRI